LLALAVTKLDETCAGFVGRNAVYSPLRMQPTKTIGITGKAREAFVKMLNHVLADECSLSATTRDYRWSIRGPNLYSLHRLFDEQRRQLDYWLNQLCERTCALGLAARSELEKMSRPPESIEARPDELAPRGMIGDLLERHEEMARKLRIDIARLGEPMTAEILKHLIEFHETSAWMLRMLHEGPESSRH
jgi:starvation-inducible DNA-binding protein